MLESAEGPRRSRNAARQRQRRSDIRREPDAEPTVAPGPGRALTVRPGHALMDEWFCTDEQRRAPCGRFGARERLLGVSRCRETTPVPKGNVGDELMPLDAWRQNTFVRPCLQSVHASSYVARGAPQEYLLASCPRQCASVTSLAAPGLPSRTHPWTCPCSPAPGSRR